MTPTQCFPVKFPKFLRSSFLTEHLQWLLLIIRNSKFWHSKWRHKNKMLDETRSNPIQHENCVEWGWKCCMKCKANSPVLLHRNIQFTETPHIYICTLNFHTPLPCNSSIKGRFPLHKINGDFTTKFIWAGAFLFVYSLAGKIFLFKIVKMNLINSQW